jgi:cysteine synthase A
MWGALRLVASMHASNTPGSVVTLLCDAGERYAATYYDDDWLAEHDLDIAPYAATLDRFYDTGAWIEPDRQPATSSPTKTPSA